MGRSTQDKKGGSQGSENIDIGAEGQSTDVASKSIKLTYQKAFLALGIVPNSLSF